MNKEQVLNQVRYLVAQRQISQEELNQAFYGGMTSVAQGNAPAPVMSTQNVSPSSTVQTESGGLMKKIGQHVSMTHILYAIGGLVVLIGILVLVAQNWNELGAVGRIVITLGSGLALYISGVLFNRNEKTNALSSVFFVISSALIPFGLFVLINESGYKMETTVQNMFLSGVMSVVFLASLAVFRNTLFVLFSTIFVTWFGYSIVSYMLDGVMMDGFEIYTYVIASFGLAHLFFGQYLSNTKHNVLIKMINLVGLIELLGATISLDGIWDFIFPLIILGVFYLSVFLKRKEYLFLGALFLVGYLIQTTAVYFADSVGWPFALIISGFILMGVGYLAFELNRRYIKS